MATVPADSFQQAVAALNALYTSPSSSDKKEANLWLEDFQAKPEAWQTAVIMLTNTTVGKEAQVFGAQTMRRKIVEDFQDLDAAHRASLRDSLLNLSMQHKTSPKIIRTQLCLSLAALSLRMLEWEQPVNHMISIYGSSTTDVSYLLEYLTVLPEEVNDSRCPSLTDDEYRTRSDELLTQNANQILKMLIVYMENSGSDAHLQEAVFKCFLSWLRSGDIATSSLSNNPLVAFSFKALQMPELFDIAVDVVCELIYQTKDIAESMPVIQEIYPNLLPLRQEIAKNMEDDNEGNVRGYCKIFVEAGECYLSLVVKHTDHFRGIVEGIAECTSYHDLDIVPMTFRFWYQLADELRKNEEARLMYQDVYANLVDVMIKHLHYPDDLDSWSAKERDDFKDFRHVMGDVLKDCCLILGSRIPLGKAYVLITQAASKSPAKWQEVEAPLMALRSMGAQVEPEENEVLPEIMKLLSQLPDHPKIKYAATLVIARYGGWTDKHPEFIQYQLSFISSGFEDEDVVAASALAMKLLCKECSTHLLNYLNQLHMFFMGVTKKLKGMDLLEVTEAVAHVVAAVPHAELAQVFQMFCLPIAQQLATLASGDQATLENNIPLIIDNISQLKIFFETVNPQVAPSETHPCISIVQELWPIMDSLADRVGGIDDVARPLAGCWRSIIISYRTHYGPLLPVTMARLVKSFEQTGLGQYLWVSSRVVREFGEANPGAALQFLEGLSASMWQILQKYSGQFNEIPDVVEDYFNLVSDAMLVCPREYLRSSLFPTVFDAMLASLQLKEQYSLISVLRHARIIVDHMNDLQHPHPSSASSQANSPRISASEATIVKAQFVKHDLFVSHLLRGIIYTFPPEVYGDATGLIKALTMFCPQESVLWYGKAVSALELTPAEMQKTVTDFTNAASEGNWSKVRAVVQDFTTIYRRKNVLPRSRGKN
ncbi:armadillo-type protein [Gamsiella multidivaricata]|uniref:armadillo-type protein n=1 Tax=Gamsiella multidivaricata TaxID=101098 RepID=UPI00221F8E45|nr:armadillo-type protein [Gamsiella multidivaricata]KAG0370572.1 Nuclear import receptor [Gamsiella multidivaricata]KAI7828134.1 armadillo-type protein [Gamsiella multidivaricata]